jgi:hypothetical protein
MYPHGPRKKQILADGYKDESRLYLLGYSTMWSVRKPKVSEERITCILMAENQPHKKQLVADGHNDKPGFEFVSKRF